jgi:hypothetical protein
MRIRQHFLPIETALEPLVVSILTQESMNSFLVMNELFGGRKGSMSNSKNLIMIVALLVLLIAAPILATDGGSAKFSVTRPLFVAGNEVKIGTYDVKWETSGQATDVTFSAIGKNVVIKAQGKIEQVDKKFDYNSLVTGKDSAGREAIRQLQFRGGNIRIVFD